MFMSLVRLDLEKDPLRIREIEPRSASLETGALPLGQRGVYPIERKRSFRSVVYPPCAPSRLSRNGLLLPSKQLVG